MSAKEGRTGSGCTLSKEDLPLVLSSLTCYTCFLVYGAMVASLGAALPSMADNTGKSHDAFGVAFTTRGVGYCAGTLISAWILSHKDLPVSKELLTCSALALCGVATIIIAYTMNFPAILVLFFFQGTGFGGIDVMANVAIPELWGAARMGPWMQALHALFGVGAIIGPALVGSIGYRSTFIIVAICAFGPLGLWLAADAYIIHNNMMHPNQHQGRKSMASVKDEEKQTEEAAPEAVGPPAPLILKIIIVALYFVYVGIESGFAGWIPTFALTAPVTNSYSKAAYLSSYFWAALTIGRVLAIFEAIVFSATVMLRTQLLLLIGGAIFIVKMASEAYEYTEISAWWFGFACSSIFPLAMTIVGDYGYNMDSSTTTMFMLSATFGEAIVPVCIGVIMEQTGPMALVYITLICSGLLCLIYLGINSVGESKQQERMSMMVERESAKNALHESGKKEDATKQGVELTPVSSSAMESRA